MVLWIWDAESVVFVRMSCETLQIPCLPFFVAQNLCSHDDDDNGKSSARIVACFPPLPLCVDVYRFSFAQTAHTPFVKMVDMSTCFDICNATLLSDDYLDATVDRYCSMGIISTSLHRFKEAIQLWMVVVFAFSSGAAMKLFQLPSFGLWYEWNACVRSPICVWISNVIYMVLMSVVVFVVVYGRIWCSWDKHCETPNTVAMVRVGILDSGLSKHFGK